MTHKDFVLIAGALANAILIDCPTTDFLAGAKAANASAIGRIADALATTNPRFDRARFLAACEGKPLTGRDKVRK